MTVSGADMQALPALIEGREAIFREQLTIARVRIDNVTVENDELKFWISYIATPGLGGSGTSHRLGAHASVLVATTRYLAAAYAGWQIYLSQEVIDRTVAIVAGLGSEMTYLADYVTRPIDKMGSRFIAVNTPGPVAAALFDFLRQQQMKELQEFPA